VIAIVATVAKQARIRISERVRAGLMTARNQGKQLGRPRVFANAAEIERLRAQGASWRAVAQKLGLRTGTARRIVLTASGRCPVRET